MNRLLAVALASISLLPALYADTNPCPCVPITHLWTVRSCTDWDCAASAFILGAGSPDVMVVPTGSADVPFVVMQRIASGTSVDPPDPTFAIEAFDTFVAASARYGTMASALTPIVLSSPDGKFLVLSRRMPEVRRRAIGSH